MSQSVINDSTLTAIADAINAKAGTTGKMLPSAMAAKITALPSGGGVDIDEVIGWISNTSTRIDFTKIAGTEIITQTTAMLQSGQWFRGSKVVREVYAPNIKYPQAYCFGGCPALKKVTVFSNYNNGYVYSGSNSLEEIVELGRTAINVMATPAFLAGLPKTCVVHAVDADVKYVDGAWTIVERS